MRILAVGDVVGSGGRTALAKLLPDIRREYKINFVCVQGENAAAGFGLTEKTAAEILECGADAITTGNHIWDRKEFIPCLESGKYPVLRPHNYPQGVPGTGAMELDEVAVVNLMGRTWMPHPVDSPVTALEQLLDSGFGSGKPILVDFHAEATSEKQALGWHFAGRVSAIVGTHTHVPTADARVLDPGTAYVSDLGMVGSSQSVLGMERGAVLRRMATSVPERMSPVDEGPMQFNAVMVEIDPSGSGGGAVNIQRIDRQCQV